MSDLHDDSHYAFNFEVVSEIVCPLKETCTKLN